MINGLVRGGPLDGKTIRSNSDYLKEHAESLVNYDIEDLSEEKKDIKIPIITYEKIHYKKYCGQWHGYRSWYEWHLKSDETKQSPD